MDRHQKGRSDRTNPTAPTARVPTPDSPASRVPAGSSARGAPPQSYPYQPPQAPPYGRASNTDFARSGRDQPLPIVDPRRTNEYFLPKEGIDREVIQTDIERYLGNDAKVRVGIYDDPQTRERREGYFINAYRNLTSAMIADLKADSVRWEAERRNTLSRQRSSHGADYGSSQVHESRNYYGPSDPTPAPPAAFAGHPSSQQAGYGNPSQYQQPPSQQGRQDYGPSYAGSASSAGYGGSQSNAPPQQQAGVYDNNPYYQQQQYGQQQQDGGYPPQNRDAAYTTQGGYPPRPDHATPRTAGVAYPPSVTQYAAQQDERGNYYSQQPQEYAPQSSTDPYYAQGNAAPDPYGDIVVERTASSPTSESRKDRERASAVRDKDRRDKGRRR